MDKLPLSVLIPTLNEARNIADCLAAVAFADDCVVFDSHSTDDTLELARAAGARVVQREFDTFSAHKNWALDNIDFAHEWILIVDADERVTPKLATEIAMVVNAEIAEDADNGYYIARQNIFQGKWLRHAGMYPDWRLRLFRRGRARYEDRLVHEHMKVEGHAGFLSHHFVHQDFKGIERYFERHNHYTSLEAIEVYRLLHGAPGGEGVIAAKLISRGPMRRRAVRQFAYRYLPLRPFILFFYIYILRLGFCDGALGFRHCLIRAFNEYQLCLKLIELEDPTSPMAAKYKHLIER